MALPPETISELKQIIHTHLSQVNILSLNKLFDLLKLVDVDVLELITRLSRECFDSESSICATEILQRDGSRFVTSGHTRVVLSHSSIRRYTWLACSYCHFLLDTAGEPCGHQKVSKNLVCRGQVFLLHYR